MKRFALTLCAAFALYAASIHASIVIDITASVPARPKAAIVLVAEKTDFTERFATRLARDIEFSDWLAVQQTEIVKSLDESSASGSGSTAVQVLIVCLFGSEIRVTVQQTDSGEKVYDNAFAITPDPVRLAHRISDAIILALTGKPGIAESRIAYVSASDQQNRIVVSDFDGDNARTLISGKFILNYPRWFPDGKKIVYLSYGKTFPRLESISIADRSVSTFLAEPGLNACVSFFHKTDRAAVVLSREGNTDIYLVNLDGKILKKLTTGTRSINASPTVSPDDSRIAFVSDRNGKTQIWTMNSSGFEARRLPIEGGYLTSPCWSPDGLLLAYSARRGSGMSLEIYDMKTGKTKTLTDPAGWAESPWWAPDSRHLLFTRIENYQPSIWVIDVFSLRTRKIADSARSGCWQAY